MRKKGNLCGEKFPSFPINQLDLRFGDAKRLLSFSAFTSNVDQHVETKENIVKLVGAAVDGGHLERHCGVCFFRSENDHIRQYWEVSGYRR